MNWHDQLETWSYLVTIIGFPWLLITYVVQIRKESRNEQEELYLNLSREYDEFLKLVLDNSDLRLLSDHASTDENDEQKERRHIMFGLLVSLFERAYILVYEDNMDRQTARLWQSWKDYIKEWCLRNDFRNSLKIHLQGEDPDFANYIREVAGEFECRPS